MKRSAIENIVAMSSTGHAHGAQRAHEPRKRVGQRDRRGRERQQRRPDDEQHDADDEEQPRREPGGVDADRPDLNERGRGLPAQRVRDQREREQQRHRPQTAQRDAQRHARRDDRGGDGDGRDREPRPVLDAEEQDRVRGDEPELGARVEAVDRRVARARTARTGPGRPSAPPPGLEQRWRLHARDRA